MTPRHILALVMWYEKQLRDSRIPKKCIDKGRTLASISPPEALAHAHYLCEGVKKFALDPKRQADVAYDFAFIQACLSLGLWYRLEQVMEHNVRLPPGAIRVDRKA